MFKKEWARAISITSVSVLIMARISPGAKSKVKSSVQRTIRTKVIETYPLLEPYIDTILPKKSQLDLMKMYE